MLPFIIIAITLFLGAWSLPVIKDPSVDQSLIQMSQTWSLPHLMNMLSTLAIIGVAVYGLLKQPRFRLGWQVLLGLITFVIALILSGATAIYYQWTPHTLSLLIQRIPIALGLLGGVAFVLLSAQLTFQTWVALALYFILQACAVACVLYTYFMDDFSFYIMAHIFPLTVLLVSNIRLKEQNRSRHLLYCLGFYICAQICSAYSDLTYQYTYDYIHGYTLRHILIALGSYYFLQFFIYLKPVELTDMNEPT